MFCSMMASRDEVVDIAPVSEVKENGIEIDFIG
jgi:hypothetical protein